LQETIKNYNIKVNNVIEKIHKLKKWGDFIEFKGIKYGKPYKISNNIHLENDCFGILVYYKTESHDCDYCREGTNYECECYDSIIYKCNKCGFLDEK
jgi:hypothetical protein